MASEFENRKEEWAWLVKNEFEDEKKKEMCKKNQANRTKNPNAINHHSGPCPVSFRAEDLLKKGSPAPLVEAALNMYISYLKENEKVQKLKRSVDKIYEQRRSGEAQNGETVDQVHPVSIPFEEQCEILIDAFGERRGTKVQGLGRAGSRPSKKRGGANMQAATIRLELEARTKKAEEEATNAKEDAKIAREDSELAIAENDALKSRIAVLEEFMTTFSKSQAPSPPSPSQGNTP